MQHPLRAVVVTGLSRGAVWSPVLAALLAMGCGADAKGGNAKASGIESEARALVVAKVPRGQSASAGLEEGELHGRGRLIAASTLGTACTAPADCDSGFCVDGVCCDVACGGGATDDCQACAVAAGAAVDGTCGARAIGAACDDGDACTTSEACQAGGACLGGTAVVCTALDQCHDPGTCDPTAGCSNPVKVNGSVCNDNDMCTTAETCQAGVCTPAFTVTCVPDQCHDVGACNPSTGLCASTTRPNGFPCDDGDPCTRVDSCQMGVCEGTNTIVCAALDGCHVPGVCDSSTGLCSNPAKGDGSSCDDGNACTLVDRCLAGRCTGTPLACDDSNACTTDSCNQLTGCVHVTVPACLGDGGSDGGRDASPVDGARADGSGDGARDAAAVDATPPVDASAVDAPLAVDATAPIDERPSDAHDGAVDGAHVDGGGGCGCRTSGGSGGGTPALAIALVGLWLVGRRRGR